MGTASRAAKKSEMLKKIVEEDMDVKTTEEILEAVAAGEEDPYVAEKRRREAQRLLARSQAQRILEDPRFDQYIGIVITANALMMGIEYEIRDVTAESEV